MIGWSDTFGTASLTYDFENRLASFITSSVTANYLYDPQGRRLQKTVNSVVTRYLWDGATMIAELDGTNQITRLYTFNPQRLQEYVYVINSPLYWIDPLGLQSATTSSSCDRCKKAHEKYKKCLEDCWLKCLKFNVPPYQHVLEKEFCVLVCYFGDCPKPLCSN